MCFTNRNRNIVKGKTLISSIIQHPLINLCSFYFAKCKGAQRLVLVTQARYVALDISGVSKSRVKGHQNDLCPKWALRCHFSNKTSPKPVLCSITLILNVMLQHQIKPVHVIIKIVPGSLFVLQYSAIVLRSSVSNSTMP